MTRAAAPSPRIPPGEERRHTFLFADLAGFTALTEAHGDQQAADLVADFSRRVGELLAELGGGEAKTVGDAVMVRGESARGAIELGVLVIERICALPGYPVIRVGINTGTAVERDGDWFGSAVNVAARVAAAASGHQVLLTEATRTAAGRLDSISLERIGPREMRNVPEPVVLYRAVRAEGGDRAIAIDPVCRMAVAPEDAAGSLEHQGRHYSFCSLRCAGAFAADPDRYLGSPGEAGS